VLQQLTYEGILESKRNCGVVVAPRPTSEIRNLLLPCRVDIEVHALRSCFHRLSEADFAQWKAIVSAIHGAAQREDVQTVVAEDRRFHCLLIEKAEIPGISGVWTAISTATQDYDNYFKEEVLLDLCSNFATHSGLLDSFQAGDLETACRVLSDHILNVGSFHRFSQQWEKAGKPHDASGLFAGSFAAE
jgi:DNA-binding GntR family transcriptional regulator